MYDILILDGFIVDGSGAPWYRADVAVQNGKIAKIGNLKDERAKQVIHADESIVAPGFIDIHTHDDLHVLENRYMDAKIRQGVTTSILGNCGFGLYPVLPENRKLFYEYATGIFGEPERGNMDFASIEEFFAALESGGSALNVASQVAHGVLGFL
jgi:N-acyl-D-amino-acid deacylase